jgi:hypothetical protein
MLKVKGNLKIGYAMVPNKKLGDGMLVSQTENIEFVLPPVNPEDLKDGQTVLLSGKIFTDQNYPNDLRGNVRKLRLDLGVLGQPILEGYADNLIVAILPEEKKEEVDSESLNDLSELKIAIWENPLTQGFILQGNEKTRWENYNQLCDIVERLVKERK